ncbi:MAG TPA: patatin-like phospholipase family protein, partial [Candidatus Cybelea sp.]
YAIRRGDDPVTGRLREFWHDNTVRGLSEQLYNDFTVGSLRMINRGLIPSFAISPSSPAATSMLQFAALGQRREFVDLGYSLSRYIDFDEVASWGAPTSAPVLVMGAASVLSGRLVKFNSTKETIKLEHILASCAVPSLFPAVEVDGDAYWDGLFSDNPPLDDLINPGSIGEGNLPREIWLIKINPTRRDGIPIHSNDIVDRRNQLEGNLSLKQNLKYIELLNDLLLAGAFKDEFLERLNFREPVLIPKAFAEEPDKPYHIPFIEMSDELQKTLDYEGKLDRSERAVQRLMADGRNRAEEFLRARTHNPPPND